MAADVGRGMEDARAGVCRHGPGFIAATVRRRPSAKETRGAEPGVVESIDRGHEVEAAGRRPCSAARAPTPTGELAQLAQRDDVRAATFKVSDSGDSSAR